MTKTTHYINTINIRGNGKGWKAEVIERSTGKIVHVTRFHEEELFAEIEAKYWLEDYVLTVRV